MPAPLALLLCTLFVVSLLRLERRVSSSVSAASWIPTLWLMAVASKPLGIWFGTAGDPEAGSPLDRLFLSALLFLAVTGLFRRQFNWSTALSVNRWLILLLGYMLLSTAWSDLTFVAFKRWTRELIMVLMLFLLLSETNPAEALESVLRRTAYVLIPFSLLLIKYYPALGVEYGRWSGKLMWLGVTVHKNCLGRLCLVVAVFLIWDLLRRWRAGSLWSDRWRTAADSAVLLLALYMLRGSEDAYSATSVATFLVGIVTLLGLEWLRKRSLLPSRAHIAAGVLGLFLFGAMAPFVGGANVARFSGTFGRNETLTGRTDTWAELVPVVKERPILGVGFGSFWTAARREFYQMSHGHNGYLDVLLDLGAVGLILWAGIFLVCAGKAATALTLDFDRAAFAIVMLAMAAIYNTSESALSSMAELLVAVAIWGASVVPSKGCVYAPTPTFEQSDFTSAAANAEQSVHG